jgi:hypothetical protein
MFGITLTNRTRILPIVVFGCETWSVALRAEIGRRAKYLGVRGNTYIQENILRNKNVHDLFSSPNIIWVIMISGFRRDVEEICALLGCYAASSSDFLPSFRDNLSVKELLLYAA